MPVDFIASNTTDGLTLKLYRGEDMVLLAFDVDDSLKKSDFVGFGIQYFVGNATRPRDVFNFLTFKTREACGKGGQEGNRAGRAHIDALAHPDVSLGACSQRPARWPCDLPGVGDVLEWRQSAPCQSHHARDDRRQSCHAWDISQSWLHARLRQLAGLRAQLSEPAQDHAAGRQAAA